MLHFLKNILSRYGMQFSVEKVAGFLALIAVCAANETKFYWPEVPPTPENVLLKSLGSAAPSGPQCNDQLLLHCQNNFNSFLNISGHADWHVPLDLYGALLQIYAQNGTQGILKVCAAYTQFYQCLGATYGSCNSPLFYLQHGYNIITAAFYPAVIAQLHFQCAGGLQTAINNWGCIQSTGMTYNQTIVNCHIAYVLNASADPAHACQYAAMDMQCVSGPFRQPCGGPTAWYLCEYTRVGLAAHLPMCTNLRCRVSSRMTEEEEILNVEEQKKLVEHLKKSNHLPDLNDIEMGKHQL